MGNASTNSAQQQASRPVLLSVPPDLVNAYTAQPPIQNNSAAGSEQSWTPHTDEEAERNMIIEALDQTRWNRTKAAELLGMSFRQLRYRIQKYELDTH